MSGSVQSKANIKDPLIILSIKFALGYPQARLIKTFLLRVGDKSTGKDHCVYRPLLPMIGTLDAYNRYIYISSLIMAFKPNWLSGPAYIPHPFAVILPQEPAFPPNPVALQIRVRPGLFSLSRTAGRTWSRTWHL